MQDVKGSSLKRSGSGVERDEGGICGGGCALEERVYKVGGSRVLGGKWTMVVVVLGWGLVEGNQGMGWMSAVGWDGTGDWETGIGVLGYGDVGWRGSGNLDDPRTPMEIRLCDSFEDLYRSLQSVCVYHRRSRQGQLLPRRRANNEGSSLGRLVTTT